MSDTALEVLDEIIENLGGTPGHHKTVVPALEEIRDLLGSVKLVWDNDKMCFTNESLSALMVSKRNGLAYGVSIPKGSTTVCTKTGANADIPAPTPGIIGRAAVDPYVGVGPFWYATVNGFVDEDGTPHVTAFEGDGNFKADGTNGDVWIMAPVLWWLMDESGEDSVTLSVSDMRLAGMQAQPQAYLPDGKLRPYMLYAKYIGSNDGNNKMASVSGAEPWAWNVSHNSLITQCDTAHSGYSGKSIADDWYLKVMFLLKYATKNSQSVFTGCVSYNFQYNPAVAEEGVNRVILTNAQAANLHVGSSMMLGTHDGATSNDRNVGANHDVFSNRQIISIEDYDDVNKAVNFDGEPFDVATTYLLSTAAWRSGVLDAVEGDGTLTDAGRTNSHEPFKIQGIETMMGIMELLGNVVLNGDAELGWQVCINYDSRKEATSITADYVATGKYLEAGESSGHHYPMYPSNANGLLLGQGTGASTTTGMGDSHYTSALGTGAREWFGGGNLTYGSYAGLWCVFGNNGLSSVFWIIGSRLSGIGRSRAAA